jgi:formamidopyrimidine-DNA glycosylase
LKKLGVNACSDADTLWPVFLRKYKNPKLRREIYKVLHDQKFFAGLGNYLVNEVMYSAGIAPLTKISSLTEIRIKLLYQWSLEKIHSSYLAGGATLKSYWSPTGKKGMFKMNVYDCKTDPHGYPVVRVKFTPNEQSTHWVPALQT